MFTTTKKRFFKFKGSTSTSLNWLTATDAPLNVDILSLTWSYEIMKHQQVLTDGSPAVITPLGFQWNTSPGEALRGFSRSRSRRSCLGKKSTKKTRSGFFFTFKVQLKSQGHKWASLKTNMIIYVNVSAVRKERRNGCRKTHFGFSCIR